MIISHKHKYLFIEVPHTASTAISQELNENYDGTHILTKHATYHDFLKIATPAEKNYFVFGGIRHPLDEAVSIYFKYKTNHKQKYTDKERVAEYGGGIRKRAARVFNFVQETDADFATYFKEVYKFPYNNLITLSQKDCDFIIRFERLQEDFAQALTLMGLEQKRPLPLVNKTDSKKKHFTAYYTPEIIDQAKRVFGPFMKEWGYEFPPEWGENSVTWLAELEFRSVTAARNFYWKYIKQSQSFYGRLFRAIR